MDKNTEKKHQAQHLYMTGGKTQKEIADEVGVSERTVHAWIHQYAWDKLRLASFQAPATIADNLCSQIVELQNAIAAREPGKRYPTPQEAEVMRKLIASWDRMKKHPSLSVHMQVLETFRNYIRPVNKDFAIQLAGYTERFIEAQSVNGYAPYQVEYGVEPVSPVLPGYEEADGLDENQPPPRADGRNPAIWGRPARDITIADYKVTPVHYIRTKIELPESDVAAEATGSIPASTEEEKGVQANTDNIPAAGSDTESSGSISAVFTSEDHTKDIPTGPQIADENSDSADPKHLSPQDFLQYLKMRDKRA